MAKAILILMAVAIMWAFVFIAAQWQLEIADNFMLNGWGAYKVVFNWVVVEDVWAVRDFWMLIMDAAFILEAVTVGGLVSKVVGGQRQ